MFEAVKEFFGYSDIFDEPARPSVWNILDRLKLEDNSRYNFRRTWRKH